jgi:predicted membrane-bound dolichyl-phosphate-mannose-protein mannosyltransferase
MKLTLRVDQGEGPYEVTTTLWVITQWERKFKRKASDLAAGIGVEDLAYLAQQASIIAGIGTPVELDSFIKRLELLEVVTDEEPAFPTDAAATAAP